MASDKLYIIPLGAETDAGNTPAKTNTINGAISNLITMRWTTSKNKYKVSFFWNIIIALPLAVISLLLGIFHPGECDYVDETNLTVAKYLLAIGIADLVVLIPLTFYYYLLWKEIVKTIPGRLACFIIWYGAFIFCWFIIGACVLFRTNRECINKGSSHVIFGLVMWIITLINMVYMCCCSSTPKSPEDDENLVA